MRQGPPVPLDYATPTVAHKGLTWRMRVGLFVAFTATLYILFLIGFLPFRPNPWASHVVYWAMWLPWVGEMLEGVEFRWSIHLAVLLNFVLDAAPVVAVAELSFRFWKRRKV